MSENPSPIELWVAHGRISVSRSFKNLELYLHLVFAFNLSSFFGRVGSAYYLHFGDIDPLGTFTFFIGLIVWVHVLNLLPSIGISDFKASCS